MYRFNNASTGRVQGMCRQLDCVSFHQLLFPNWITTILRDLKFMHSMHSRQAKWLEIGQDLEPERHRMPVI